jgi:hypothetical protein
VGREFSRPTSSIFSNSFLIIHLSQFRLPVIKDKPAN